MLSLYLCVSVPNVGTSIMSGCSMIQTTCRMTIQIISYLLKRGGGKEIDISMIMQ